MNQRTQLHTEAAIYLDSKRQTGITHAARDQAGVRRAYANSNEPTNKRLRTIHSGLLHFATTAARGSAKICCDTGKDVSGEPGQNVAMAKQPKKTKRPSHYLREWREYRQLTQEQLAAAVRPATKASVISLLESGDRGLSNKWLERLAGPLGTKKGFILDMNPNDTDTSILEIWGLIPEQERPRVLSIMETFKKKTGTGN